MGYHVVHLVSSAVGDGGGCSVKAGGVPSTAPGVQCCWGGGGTSREAGVVQCGTPGVLLGRGGGSRKAGAAMRYLVFSAVGEGRRGCSIKVGAVPCSTPAVGEGAGVAGGVPCSISVVQCCGGWGRGCSI